MPDMARPAQRTSAFGETIFSEITALALEHGAVNLGQGFPDFDPPAFVLEAGREIMADPSSHQYARNGGLPALCETLAGELAPRLGWTPDPMNELTVTVGATEALFATTLALVDPGDEAVLIEPFYDSYPANVAIAGGTCRHVPLLPGRDGRWELELDDLRAAFSARTAVVFLNTPHNPTGKVFTAAELTAIAELCQEHDAVAICDEVYERIVFDGAEHRALAALPGMRERTVTISSAGKTFSVTGWKIGWAAACPELTLAIRRIHQWIPFCVATPLQLAVARTIELARTRGYYDWLAGMYQGKRDRLVQTLAGAGLAPITPEGTYFVVADFSGLGERFEDDVAFCRHLTVETGVAAIPPSAFYCAEHQHLARRLARFCFCKEDRTLEAAAERLTNLRS